MKRVFLFLMMLASVSLVKAQDIDYMQNFPHREGTTFVSQTFDGNNTLLSTMTTKINKVYNYVDGSTLEIGYIVRDNMNNILNQGTIDVRYEQDDMMIGMSSRASYNSLANYLSETTQLTGNFMDVPQLYTNPYEDEGQFEMSRDTNIQVMGQDGKSELGNVKVENRKVEKRGDKVTTPAGTFDATKIAYTVELMENGMENTYKGYEWFAPEGGIVRSEIYDRDNNLVGYTVLTSVTK